MAFQSYDPSVDYADRLRRMMQKAAKEQLALREAQQGAA